MKSKVDWEMRATLTCVLLVPRDGGYWTGEARFVLFDMTLAIVLLSCFRVYGAQHGRSKWRIMIGVVPG